MSKTHGPHLDYKGNNKEKLIIERRPSWLAEWRGDTGRFARERDEEIAQYNIGDFYEESFSTTSPPAFVSNEYMVTRKDAKGLWGVLLQGEIDEFGAEDVI